MMLPLSIVKGSGLAEAPFFLSDYKYKTEAGSNLGGSTSCNKNGPIANLLNWRSRDCMCSDLINRGTIVLLKLLFNYFVFLHAWLLGTYIVSGFFFLYDFYVCHRSVSTLVQKRQPIDVDSIMKLRAHRTKTQRTADYQMKGRWPSSSSRIC